MVWVLLGESFPNKIRAARPVRRHHGAMGGWETKGKELEDMDDFMPAAH